MRVPLIGVGKFVTSEMSSTAAGGSDPPLPSFFHVNTSLIGDELTVLPATEPGIEILAVVPLPAVSVLNVPRRVAVPVPDQVTVDALPLGEFANGVSVCGAK